MKKLLNNNKTYNNTHTQRYYYTLAIKGDEKYLKWKKKISQK
jgi:hypothetical protein